jgi:hypothetical protein
MRRLILAALAGLLTCSYALFSVPHHNELVFVDWGTGYRQDDFLYMVRSTAIEDFSRFEDFTQDHHRKTHLTSKVKWSDLEIYQTMLAVRVVTCDRFYFRAKGDYGHVYRGHHKDQEILKRKCKRDIKLFSASGRSDNGNVWDASLGVGYFMRFLGDRATLAPIAGYQHSEQHLRVSHLNVKINKIDFILGPLAGLHSKYRAQWYGAWAGMDGTLQMTCNWGLYGSAEFHWPRFRGRGHWNLRHDFEHGFRQRSDGYGQIYFVGLNYDLTHYWKLGVTYNYQKWYTGDGKQKEFHHDRHVHMKLSGVRWVTQAVMANLEYIY